MILESKSTSVGLEFGLNLCSVFPLFEMVDAWLAVSGNTYELSVVESVQYVIPFVDMKSFLAYIQSIPQSSE
jgi:hypothetical protein